MRGYIEDPGRPTLFDAFAKSEDAFAFSNCKRKRFQSVWVAAIDAIIAERQAQSSSTGHRDYWICC